MNTATTVMMTPCSWLRRELVRWRCKHPHNWRCVLGLLHLCHAFYHRNDGAPRSKNFLGPPRGREALSKNCRSLRRAFWSGSHFRVSLGNISARECFRPGFDEVALACALQSLGILAAQDARD